MNTNTHSKTLTGGLLTHGAVSGEVGLDGSSIILWDPLIIAGRDPKRRSSVCPRGEVDHCPAAKERKQE